MPFLVEKKEEGKTGGIWEVKWTWMPAFLAMDKSLVEAVDQRLNQLFAGGDPPLPGTLEKTILDVICQKYPMQGLREALQALQQVDPTIHLHLVDEVPTPEETGTASLGSGSPSPTFEQSPGGQE